jgi:hypothetical protein
MTDNFQSVRELIREDEKRAAKEQLENMLLEGLKSKQSPLTRASLNEIRREGMKILAAGKSAKTT